MSLRLWVAVSVATFIASTSQTAHAGAPDYQSARTPESPALAVLGSGQTQIERPTTPKAVALVLRNSFASNGTVIIPNEFALDLSIYWLWDHPNYTYEQYVEDGG